MSSSPIPFVHLHSHSAFSFLAGPSPVEFLVLRAAKLEQPALALTDTNRITGVVSLTKRCAKAGVKPIGGCEVVLEGGQRLTLLMDGPTGWMSLSRLLSSVALRDTRRNGLRVRWEELEAYADGLVCLSGDPDHSPLAFHLRRRQWDEAEAVARRCLSIFGRSNFFIEITRTLADGNRETGDALVRLADHLGVPVVATNAARYAAKSNFAAYEALLRVRLGVAPGEQHGELSLNGEQYLKSSTAMQALFTDLPQALENAISLADRLQPPLDPSVRHLPRYPQLPEGESAFSYLSALTYRGAAVRYKSRMTPEVQSRLVQELETIRALDFADYFLVCWDVCKEARKRKIGHGLRGSAVGSAVAYCLWLSHHDPIERRVSFERFLSPSRAKPPDVDIDFRHDLRDEMMTYCRDTYGHDKVANVSNYITYRGRSLLRDFGKVLGFDTPDIDRLRELLSYSRGAKLAEELAEKPELRALGIDAEQYADLFALCASLAGLPRHLGTHSSGLVISDVPLAHVAPIEWAAKGVTVAALDKDDVEAPGVGLLKMDQLSLRALTAVDLTLARLDEAASDDLTVARYAARDRDDEETLALIRTAQTVGVFQLESPAQMALQWRLQADKFDDLVASVALIRPGPLLGKTVERYIQRRKGWEAVTYPLPELEPVLQETFGRILFQDQVLDVVRVVGGYTPDEADGFLKTMTHARDEIEMKRLGVGLMERAKERGMTKKAFSKLWKQIQGFSRYGFCHGHSLAFADHAQGTAYLLTHHPAEFLASVLSVEPCGFWPIATVVQEARRRGIVPLAPCMNRSDAHTWSIEENGASRAIRCSLGFVQTVTPDAAQSIVDEREARGPFASLADWGKRCAPFLSREQMEWLVLSGALDGICKSRRRTLWSLPSLRLFTGGKHLASENAEGQQVMPLPVPPLLPPNLPDFGREERFSHQFAAIGFGEDGHPMQWQREKLMTAGVLPCAGLQDVADGQEVQVAGWVLRPHRPPTQSGQVWVFFTLEDETGLAHVTVSPDLYEQVGPALFGSVALVVCGKAQKRGTGILLFAQYVSPLG